MKYPCINQQVEFFVDPEISEFEDGVVLYNPLTENLCEVNRHLADILLQLDGKTNPYDFIEKKDYAEMERILKLLRKENMLRKSVYRKGLKAYIPIFYPKDRLYNSRQVRFITNFIKWCAFPVFAIGIYVMVMNRSNAFSYQLNWELYAGAAVGMIFGLIFHEFSHMIFGLSYNAKTTKFGLCIGLLSGAYVASDQSTVKTRWERLNIYAAGIFMNIFLAGLFLVQRRLPIATFYFWQVLQMQKLQF